MITYIFLPSQRHSTHLNLAFLRLQLLQQRPLLPLLPVKLLEQDLIVNRQPGLVMLYDLIAAEKEHAMA